MDHKFSPRHSQGEHEEVAAKGGPVGSHRTRGVEALGAPHAQTGLAG